MFVKGFPFINICLHGKFMLQILIKWIILTQDIFFCGNYKCMAPIRFGKITKGTLYLPFHQQYNELQIIHWEYFAWDEINEMDK